MTLNCEPRFLEGPSGHLLTLYFPAANATLNQTIIHVPAFAEEMNKARNMISRQARRLALLGYDVILFDFFGTGDSEGNFGDASWESWLKDLMFVVRWAERKNVGEISLWGLRSGCLIITEFLTRYTGEINKIVFWQPVTSGKVLLTQFFRLSLAARLTSGGQPHSTQTLEERLHQGESIEIAGYELSPELALPLAQARIDSVDTSIFRRLIWLELSTLPDPTFLPASQRILQVLKDRQVDVYSEILSGSSFWSTQELSLAESLLSTTTDLLSRETEHVR